jgi:TRAP-type C4-dicarboxylate transport system permease small subunit
VKPTRPAVLAGITAACGVLAYAALRLWQHFGSPPPVPLSAPITLAVLAAAVFGVALGLRARLHAYREARLRAMRGEPRVLDRHGRPPKPIDPLQAARALVLGKAAGLVGAIFGGMYGGYGLTLINHLDIATYRAQAIRCLFAFLAGVALMIAAIVLERILRVPPEQPSPPSTGDNKHAARA